MARLSWPGWLVTYKDGLRVLKTVTHPSTNRALIYFVDATNDVTNKAKPPPRRLTRCLISATAAGKHVDGAIGDELFAARILAMYVACGVTERLRTEASTERTVCGEERWRVEGSDRANVA